MYPGRKKDQAEKTNKLPSRTRRKIGQQSVSRSVASMFHFLHQNEEWKKQVFECLKPVAQMVYNELYLYIWFICIYSIFLMIITLGNMFVLLKMWSRCIHDHQHQHHDATTARGPDMC